MNRDDLAARLAEHHWDLAEWDVNKPLNLCTCGKAIGTRPSEFTEHIADVALAWFQEQTTEKVEMVGYEPVGVKPRCGAAFAGYDCTCDLPPGHREEGHAATFFVGGTPRRIEWTGDYSSRVTAWEES